MVGAVGGNRDRLVTATVQAMKLNPALQELGTYPIAAVRERAAERRRAGLPVIDFSIGDPREPTPAFIPDALRAAVPAVSQYPTSAGKKSLREAVAAYVQRRHGIVVDPETQVVPTSGSKESIFSMHLAFVDPRAGDVVAFPSPGYPVYERGARFAGANLHRVVLDGDFIMRASDIPDDIWDRARIVWTCTPHNPSGSVSSNEDLSDLYRKARTHGVLLASDECYADTYEDDVFPDGPASILQVAEDGIEGALVFLSLSKRSGMTGYRSGAIVGDAEAIAALKQLRETTGTASPDFVQDAAAAAWSDDAHAAERRTIFTAKRRILKGAFTKLGMEVVASKAGLYLWVKVGDDIATSDRLLEQGVVVSPGRFFGQGGEGFIRLALVPALEECEQAATALTDALG
jgi:succinyldiaminopimelate transaminase